MRRWSATYDSLGQLYTGATGEQPPKLDFARSINNFATTLRLPYRLKEDLHKLRAWRNACVHGVELSDGTSARWIDRPQGPPIFPEREDVKTLFAAIHEGDGGLGARLAALG